MHEVEFYSWYAWRWLKNRNIHTLLTGFYAVKGKVEEFKKGNRSLALITLNAKILSKEKSAWHHFRIWIIEIRFMIPSKRHMKNLIKTMHWTQHTSSFFFMHSMRIMKRCCAWVRVYVKVFWMVTSNWSLKDSLISLKFKKKRLSKKTDMRETCNLISTVFRDKGKKIRINRSLKVVLGSFQNQELLKP